MAIEDHTTEFARTIAGLTELDLRIGVDHELSCVKLTVLPEEYDMEFLLSPERAADMAMRIFGCAIRAAGQDEDGE